MSSATWRNVFTYVLHCLFAYVDVPKRNPIIFYLFIHNRGCSYNKYTQIAARAVRQSLKEKHRVAAEKRGLASVGYQRWEDGKQVGPLFLCVALWGILTRMARLS